MHRDHAIPAAPLPQQPIGNFTPALLLGMTVALISLLVLNRNENMYFEAKVEPGLGIEQSS